MVTFVLKTFDGKEALQGVEAVHFLNSIIKKRLEGEEKHLQHSGVVLYS